MKQAEAQADRIDWLHSLPVFLVHLAPLLAFWTGTRWSDWLLCVALYIIRMFFLTAGYHRYFAHRSYKLGRVMQFLMAFGGATAAQKGVLWWAAHHRDHHLYSDTERDIHSPTKGFWWSHMVWFLCGKHKETKFDRIRDFETYPELRWLNRWWIIPPTMLGITCWIFGGWSALLIGFLLSTVILWHGTFTINSLSHVWGSRRFDTQTDDSRNNPVLALITLGEGWHNNHHHVQTSARQGFYWWEIDISFYAIMVLSWLRLARGIMTPTAKQLARHRLKKGAHDFGKEAAKRLRDAYKAGGRYYAEKRQDLADAVDSAKRAAEDMVQPSTESHRSDAS
ncbi:MAG: acyl-CoA desaturase [Patescibacteria group bacterium]